MPTEKEIKSAIKLLEENGYRVLEIRISSAMEAFLEMCDAYGTDRFDELNKRYLELDAAETQRMGFRDESEVFAYYRDRHNLLRSIEKANDFKGFQSKETPAVSKTPYAVGENGASIFAPKTEGRLRVDGANRKIAAVREPTRAYTLKQVRDKTGLSVIYLRQRIGKELKITRFGRAIRVLEEDLDNFLRNGVQTGGTK